MSCEGLHMLRNAAATGAVHMKPVCTCGAESPVRDWLEAEKWHARHRLDTSRVRRAAEVLLADHASEYEASHLSWEDFARQAQRVLEAALSDGAS